MCYFLKNVTQIDNVHTYVEVDPKKVIIYSICLCNTQKKANLMFNKTQNIFWTAQYIKETLVY